MSPVVDTTVSGHTFGNLDWRILYVNKRERMKPTEEERQEQAGDRPGGKFPMPAAPEAATSLDLGSVRQMSQHPHHKHPQRLKRV